MNFEHNHGRLGSDDFSFINWVIFWWSGRKSTTSWWFQRFNPFEMNIFVKFSSSPQVGKQKLTPKCVWNHHGPTGYHPLPHLRIQQKKGGRGCSFGGRPTIFVMQRSWSYSHWPAQFGIRGIFFPSQITWKKMCWTICCESNHPWNYLQNNIIPQLHVVSFFDFILISPWWNLYQITWLVQGSMQLSPDQGLRLGIWGKVSGVEPRGDGGDPLSQDVLRWNPPDFMWHMMLYLQLITCNDLQRSYGFVDQFRSSYDSQNAVATQSPYFPKS